MLQVASYFIGDNDQEARNAIAKLNGISVHSYHFAAPGLYDPAAAGLDSQAIRSRRLEAPGRCPQPKATPLAPAKPTCGLTLLTWT